MITVAVTGGIGSGKSTVCRLFAGLGVPVFDSDAEAKRSASSDPEAVAAVKALLGAGSYNSDGTLNRTFVSSKIFSDSGLLARYEAIIHPAVGRAFDRWAAAQAAAGARYVLLESAILFESGFDRYADRIVTVSAPESLRTERCMARDGLPRESVEQRMARQMSDAERESRSDYVVVNIDLGGLRTQVEALHEIFSAQGGPERTLRVGEQRVDLATPAVMAIINVTPDSFHAGSRTMECAAIEERLREAAAAGARIIDIGGCSTRPGAEEVSAAEEYSRLARGVEAARRCLPDTALSIDTWRSDVAARIIDGFGPCIINDISGGELDPQTPDVAAEHGVPFVAMHMRGTPATMQSLTQYDNFAAEILGYFRSKVRRLRRAGVEQIILDPGFGFAKTTEQNFALLSLMGRLREEFPELPLLAGLSRKSMIYTTLGTTPAEALNGTTALHWECLRQGASILRVHDAKEAAEVVALHEKYEQSRIRER